MTFHWDIAMQIDNGPIDNDHKKMIAIANRVLELSDPKHNSEELKQIIYELYDYVKYHFASEEDIMRKLGYPELHIHQEKHALIIQDMNHYLSASTHIGEILSNFRRLINRWVIGHILEEDVKIHKFMEIKLRRMKK